MRQIHHWAAVLFVAAMSIHLLRIFFTGAFRKPRELNWLIGIVMLFLGIVEGFIGYGLPDDLLSGTGLRITEGLVLASPVVGTYLSLLHLRWRVPRRRLRLPVLHRPRATDSGHPARTDHRPSDPGRLPQAHPVPRSLAGPRRTSSATR